MKFHIRLAATRWMATTVFAVVQLLFLVTASAANAQNAGDYRTVSSGNWNDAGIWERFDGSSWQPAVTSPTSADGEIRVRSPHVVAVTANVVVDETLVESGAQVTLDNAVLLTVSNGTGTDFSVSGTFSNQGTVSLASDAELAVSDGGTLDLLGSSLIAGSGDFNLNTNGTLRIGSSAGISATPGSSGNVQNTGTRFFSTRANYVYAGTSAQSTGSGLPVTVNNLDIDNSSGVSLTSDVAVSGFDVPVNGTLALANGVFQVGSNTLRLDGPISVGSGSLASSANGTVNYNQVSNGQVVIVADYGNLAFSNFAKTLPSGGVVGIAGTFTPGGGVGHSVSGSTIEFNGSGSQTVPTFDYDNLTADNAAGVTLGGSTEVDGTFSLAAGTFAVGSQTLTLNGNVTGSGTFTSSSNGRVQYFQGQNGQDVLAGSYGNLTFDDFDKVLPSSGTVGISGTFTPGTATGHTITGSTIEYNGSGSPQALPSDFTTYHNLVLDNSAGTNGFDGLVVNALVRVQSGMFAVLGTSDFVDVQIDGGGAELEGTSGATIQVSGSWTNNGNFNAMGSTVVFDGSSSQTIAGSVSTTFAGLTIDNGAGVSLDLNALFNGVLAFTNGNVVTGSNALIQSGGSASVVRTNGHVDGNFRKPVALGAPVLDFEIGSGTDYTPVNVNFTNVEDAGNLTASTTAGEHPDVANSGLNTSKNVNRYYSLATASVTFDSADLTFHFVPGDVDGSADTDSFEVRKFDSPDWTDTNPGTRTATSTQAIGITNFSDFAVGELIEFTITAAAGANGVISPSGAILVRHGKDITFGITPDPGYHVDDVVVDAASEGPSLSYTFGNVTANHTIDASFAETFVSIADLSQNEGNVIPEFFDFAVSRTSAVTPHTVSVNYSTQDSSAMAPGDYEAVVNAMLTFNSGTTDTTVTISINGDLVNEADEVFFVNLTSPANVSISDGQGRGVIVNDDPVPSEPSISIDDVTIDPEGDSGTQTAVFTVTLSQESGQTVTVDYATDDGSAVAPDDYTSTSGTVSFSPGDTEETISVPVKGDVLDELDQENFFVNLSNPQNGNFIGGDDQGEGTIVDDDPTTTILSIDDVSDSEGDSATKSFDFTVSLSEPTGRTVTASYQTANGTAVAPGDYAASSGTVSLAPGETSQTVSVTVNGDTKNEDDETFTVTLSNVVGANEGDLEGFGTIQNDDPVPALAIDDVSDMEGDSGTTTYTFTVTLTPASGKTVSVDFATADGSATVAGGDYDATSGTLTFQENQTSMEIDVSVNGDLLNEVDENFFVDLSNAQNASVSDAQGEGTILNDDPLPNISIDDVTMAEGTNGTTDFVFTVTLDDPSGRAIAVDYATANGTAVAPDDYGAGSGTISFAPGETSRPLTIQVVADALDEANSEDFFVNLSNASNANISDNQGRGQIDDDDDLPEVSVDDVSDAEGDAGTKDFTFTVSLSSPSGRTVTVNYATNNGSAVAPGDYASDSGVITFNPGETSKPLPVSVNGDVLNEADENFFVNLSSPQNATFGDNTGQGTIQNDDGVTATVSINDVTMQEGNVGSSSFTFTISLSELSGQAVTVDFATADGTATVADNDYESASGTATIFAGQPSTTVSVTVNGDLLNEDDQTFFVNLSNPMNATIADGQGVGTIVNDDAVPLGPSISINNVSDTEGDSGTKSFSFEVSLSESSQQTITVDFETADGSAQAPVDYASTSGTLTFAPGDTLENVSVTVNGDALNEADETFFVSLSNPQNAPIADGQGQGTIQNDDPVTATISIDDVSVAEGNSGTVDATFTVTLSEASGQTVSVDYATADDTATTGDSDYQGASGTVSFPAGSTSQTLTVLIVGDTRNEDDETFFVDLSNPQNATLADNQGDGTIQNDDPEPSIGISDVSVNEGNVNASFTVTLSAASGKTVTVDYATADGSAVDPADYTGETGTVTFAPDDVSETVTVGVLEDALDENDENFFVNLANASNASIADAQGEGTIVDDDPPPNVEIGDVTMEEGDSGTKSFHFAVVLNAVSGRTVAVDYATTDGTAVAPDDYVTKSGTVTFQPGEDLKAVTIVVNGDLLNENAEVFFVNLSNPQNVNITDGQGTGQILNDDPEPSLSIDDVSASEGDSGTQDYDFTVTLDAPSGKTVTVDYATQNGSALAPSDYTAASGTLTFDPGETSQPVSVAVNGDVLNEADENFFVNLSNAQNATSADNQGEGTIVNDDPVTATISINDVTMQEGNVGSSNFTFTVSLSEPSGQDVTVDFATADGTATDANNDYEPVSGTMTIPAGQPSSTIQVQVNADLVNEDDETFFVNLSNATNSTIADNQGVGTIVNDDDVPLGPTISINDVSDTEGDSGTKSFVFDVTLSESSEQTITVDFETADGSAQAPTDYASTSGTVTFVPGDTQESVSVTVQGDVLNEANETFFVNLSNPQNAPIADGQGQGTIQNDDDPTTTISIGDVMLEEGDSGTTAFSFQVTLSEASGQTVSVDYTTADDTATTEDSDYQSASGTIVFVAGSTSQNVTIQVNGDTRNENDETFFVDLSNPQNATIADGQGEGTIQNDDPEPAITITDASVTEGNVNASFTVTLSAASGKTVTVDFATADGSAEDPDDYTAGSGTLTFVPDDVSETVTVSVNEDALDEDDENFFVNLSSASNASISDDQGEGTIVDDDPLPSVSIDDVSQPEGDSGTTDFVFTVTLSPVSGRTVTVDYTTSNGTATVGDTDYVMNSGTLTFPRGTTTQTVSVTVNGDTRNEDDESFFVDLSNAPNATISDSQGQGTIENDDPVPTLAIDDVTVAEGDAGTVTAGFTVTLSAESGKTVTVNYATQNQTATAPGDYTANSGTLTFGPGETSKPVDVLVNGDTIDEDDETFLVNLTNPQNANTTDGDPQGVGTITDDDPQTATISIADAAQAEGDIGTSEMTFVVSLSEVSGKDVTVDYATSDGSATTADTDYVAESGSVTIPAGQTATTLDVTIVGDTDATEGDEFFFVDLSNAQNASIADGEGKGTIQDDDAGLQSSLAIDDVSVTEGDGGTTDAIFTVTLSPPNATQTVTVDFQTINDTAVAPDDYAATSGQLSFAPTETQKTITVPVVGDEINEDDETFLVLLTNATNAIISDGQGQGTITDDDSATLAIDDVTVTEGDVGTVDAEFTVTLSPASSQTVTVDFATADGSAVAPDDYASSSGTLTFSPGETTKPVTVSVQGDMLSEASESFFVNLSNPTVATISDGQGIGTIEDNDGTPNLSIDDVTVTEGNAGTTDAVFTVTLSEASGQSVTVDFATSDGSAGAPDDYTSNSGTLTFDPGETSQSVTVVVNGDNLNEADEFFFVDLSNPQAATLADDQGEGTIENDDPVTATLSIDDVAVTEGNAGTTDAVFTVTLSEVSGQTVTVDYASDDGSAVAPDDYASASGTVSFAPGETAQNVTVQVQGDVLDEIDESYFVNLSNAQNATVADNQGEGTILDDDDPPGLSIDDVSVIEGDSGTTDAVFTVSLSEASGQTVTVDYATADGSATAPADYAAGSGTLSFSPGQTSKNVTVQVQGDVLAENDENFFVDLSNPQNATILDGQGEGTIQDDDALPAISVDDVSVTEGDPAVFTVSLSVASGQTITVDFATADSTATAPGDYTSGSGTVTFGPGETSKSVAVATIEDTTDEPDEHFLVELSNPQNATIADGRGVGTIVDDDDPPSLAIDDVSQNEGDSGQTAFGFTVSLSEASAKAISVDFATADSTAMAPADYVANSGTLNFVPGEISKPVIVQVEGDMVNEDDEVFLVNLSGAQNATIADGQGLGTIVNEDAGTVTISIDDVMVTEGDNGDTTNAVFTVSLSAASLETVTVQYETQDGSATDGQDYTGGSGTLTFELGETSMQVVVPVIGDKEDEPDEDFFVNLSNSTNAAIADSQGVGTIVSEPTNALPQVTKFALSPVAPNPTWSHASIRFALPRAANVRLRVVDVRGREVAILANERYESGRYEIVWNGRHTHGGRVGAGVYFVLFDVPGHRRLTERVIWIR